MATLSWPSSPFFFFFVSVIDVQRVQNGLEPLERHYTRYLSDIEEVTTPVDVDVMSWIGSHQDEHPQESTELFFHDVVPLSLHFFTNTVCDQNSLL